MRASVAPRLGAVALGVKRVHQVQHALGKIGVVLANRAVLETAQDLEEERLDYTSDPGVTRKRASCSTSGAVRVGLKHALWHVHHQELERSQRFELVGLARAVAREVPG